MIRHPLRILLAAVLLATLSAERCTSEPIPAPQQAGNIPIRLEALGSPKDNPTKRAHITVIIGGKKKIDRERDLPWRWYTAVKPTDLIDYSVALRRIDDPRQKVECRIYIGEDAKPTDQDGPKYHAQCALAPIARPA